MGELKVPTVLAVAAWVASGLCVLSYTYTAFKETSSSSSAEDETGGLSANPKILGAELLPMIKPLERGKFKASK